MKVSHCLSNPGTWYLYHVTLCIYSSITVNNLSTAVDVTYPVNFANYKFYLIHIYDGRIFLEICHTPSQLGTQGNVLGYLHVIQLRKAAPYTKQLSPLISLPTEARSGKQFTIC